MRTIDRVEGKICIIDQTRLPTEEPVLHLETVEGVTEEISSLRVRGAPALGGAGGSGSPSRRDGRGSTIAATHTPHPPDPATAGRFQQPDRQNGPAHTTGRNLRPLEERGRLSGRP